MLNKIYFGDKPLVIAEKETEETQFYLDDINTRKFKIDTRTEIQSLIQAMQHENINAGIILGDVNQTMEKLKKEFTNIQASGGLVYSSEKKVLLIFRRGKWDLPKGKLDEGEDLVECAVREVKEETGLSELLYNEFLCTSYHTYHERGSHILKESHWHLLKGNESELLVPQIDEDIEKCKWVNEEELSPYLENAPRSIIDVLETGLNRLKKNNKF